MILLVRAQSRTFQQKNPFQKKFFFKFRLITSLQKRNNYVECVLDYARTGLSLSPMKKLTPIFGWIGFSIGIITATAAPLPGWGTPIAFFCMLPGFILCSIYILFSTRFQLETKWINPGYIGMLLNSTPLLMLLYFQISK